MFSRRAGAAIAARSLLAEGYRSVALMRAVPPIENRGYCKRQRSARQCAQYLQVQPFFVDTPVETVNWAFRALPATASAPPDRAAPRHDLQRIWRPTCRAGATA